MPANLRLFHCGHCHCSFWATYRGYARVACEKPECQAWRKKQRPRLIRTPTLPKPRKCRFCRTVFQPGPHGGRSQTCPAEACQAKSQDRFKVQRAAAVRRTRQKHDKAVPKHKGHAYSRRVMKCENCGRLKLCIWTKICLDCKRAIEQGYDLDLGFYDNAGREPISQWGEL